MGKRIITLCCLFIGLYFLTGYTFKEQDDKLSAKIFASISYMDIVIEPTFQKGYNTTENNILELRKAQSVIKKLSTEYMKVTNDTSSKAFDDLAQAVGYWADYLETGNYKYYHLFYDQFLESRSKIIRYAQELKARGR